MWARRGQAAFEASRKKGKKKQKSHGGLESLGEGKRERIYAWEKRLRW